MFDERNHLRVEIVLYNVLSAAFTLVILVLMYLAFLTEAPSGSRDLIWAQNTLAIGWVFTTAGFHYLIHRVRPVLYPTSEWEKSPARKKMRWLSGALMFGQATLILPFYFRALMVEMEMAGYGLIRPVSNIFLALGIAAALAAPRAGAVPGEK